MLAMGRSGGLSDTVKTVSERYRIPDPALILFTVVGIIVAYIAAPLPPIYHLIDDAVVAGYIGFAVNPTRSRWWRSPGKAAADERTAAASLPCSRSRPRRSSRNRAAGLPFPTPSPSWPS